MLRFTPCLSVLIIALAACSSPPPANNAANTTGSLGALAADPVVNPVSEVPPIEDRDMGDYLIISLDAEPGVLNTILDTGDASTNYICDHIFETLLEIDRETLGMKPRLAYECEVSDDHLTYTFKIHENAVFSKRRFP